MLWLRYQRDTRFLFQDRPQVREPCEQASIRHQCEVLGIVRSGLYYEPCPETAENLALMRQLEQMHLEHPVYGSRRLLVLLRRQGYRINRKRVMPLLGMPHPDGAQVAKSILT
ncbi:MAG: IS3 family transposase [Verrucomicrobiota bacterium]